MLCALACLAVAIGAPAVPDVCNPHLILKDGTRMKDDVRSHFNWNSSCFGSTLLILLSEKGGFINAITTTGGTPYCRGLVQLLSLVEAYGWTGNMCLNKSLHFSGEKKPCDSTDDVFLQLNDWNRKLTDMKYDGLADVVNQMMVTLGGSRCLDTCGGYLGSQLCSTLIKAVGYFVVKYDEGVSQFTCVNACIVCYQLLSLTPSLLPSHSLSPTPPLFSRSLSPPLMQRKSLPKIASTCLLNGRVRSRAAAQVASQLCRHQQASLRVLWISTEIELFTNFLAAATVA